MFIGLGDKSIILSPFSTIIKGVRENIRVAYICRNGDKTALFVPEAHGCWLFGPSLLSPWGQSPASLFLHVPPKARCRAASGHLSPVAYGRGQNGSAGTKSEGTKWECGDNLRHPSSSMYLSKGGQSPMPCGFRAFVPCDVWRGQIRGDKSEGTNQRGQIRQWKRNGTLYHIQGAGQYHQVTLF